MASLSLAGVEVVDAHLVPPEGGRRGYYLRPEDSETLRALDAQSHRS